MNTLRDELAALVVVREKLMRRLNNRWSVIKEAAERLDDTTGVNYMLMQIEVIEEQLAMAKDLLRDEARERGPTNA